MGEGYLKVFVSHSSRDDVTEIVEAEIKSRGHDAYLAEKDISGERMEEKFATNISDSNFVLVLWTKNVATSPVTRDLVIWEIGLGRQFGKKIIAFVDEGLEASILIKQITTYHTVNFANKDNVRTAVGRFISRNLRSDNEIYDEFWELHSRYRHANVAIKVLVDKYGYVEEDLNDLLDRVRRRREYGFSEREA